jgi:hypothetical protein
MQKLPVYDVVLLPPTSVNQAAIALSQEAAALGTEFTLNDSTAYPHLSLYMANLTPDGSIAAQHQLSRLCAQAPAITLTATHFNSNDQGMFEVFYDKTSTITRLQEAVIAALNPLRIGLRERDPVGRELAEYITRAPAEARANLEHFGYDEIGTFFKPHITFTRFKQRNQQIAALPLPAPETFSAAYATLALCEMGEHGTCTRIIASYTLGA